ncbi:alpha-tocopherol transfer protein-like isoform X2 [Venturia canescens]|uniref:alpha-tocopherol transfer protein-like isoform X2 n=1 Tax=Venturia canescens TaxID=32260 RepID=UPI001C9C7968|nr:alpha-tocopherol transfer protein-like isoform X2 [Venturia canescens]
MENVGSTKITIEGQRLIDRANKSSSLKVGDIEIRFEPEDLDEEYVKKAREELGETEEVVVQALAEIRRLVEGEPDLKVPDDDDFYKKFLRTSKWHATPAFNLMKRFYQYRINRERVCKNLVPSNERAILSSGIITPLPLRCKDGTRLLLVEGGKRWKPKEITLEQIFRGVMLSLEAASTEPKTQVAGARVIIDMDGLTLSHVTYYTPSFANMVLEWVQKCLPTRLKGIHIINQPYIFNMVFAIFKPFIQVRLINF